MGIPLTSPLQIVRLDAERERAGAKDGCGAAPMGRVDILRRSQGHPKYSASVAYVRSSIQFVFVLCYP